MNTSVHCPCCSSKLIHHLSNHRDYWFCRKCWQEMPDIKSENNTEKTINQKTVVASKIAHIDRLKIQIN